MNRTITVSVAAETLDRPRRTVAQWCADHGIGEMVTPRLRLLSASDVRRLRQIRDSMRPGNPGVAKLAKKAARARWKKRGARA